MSPAAIYLVYEGRLGSARADSTFVIENARVFSRYTDVTIVVSKRSNWTIPGEIQQEFKIIELGRPFNPKGIIGSILGQLRFSMAVRLLLNKLPPNSTLIFHDWWPTQLIRLYSKSKRKINICLEVHNQIPLSLPLWLTFWHIDLFVATNHIKYVELYRYFGEKVTLEPNCVRLDRYLKFREDKYPSLNTRFTITYTGSFGIEKNPDLLIEISEKRSDIVFCLVGKIPGSLRLHLRERQNVELHGPVGVDIIPRIQMESTALLVTLEPRNVTSSKYTSVMKLIEYIAAGRPIIAPNLDSVLAILDSSEFYSYVADSADSLSAAIDCLQADVLRESIRLPRAERLDQYSWDLRNSRLLNRISLL